ncbi:MAG TPA: ferrous iron transport protein A [Clostridiaceae bacterium]|jgi:ferrous iron transport protein A|nr:ferrous iron transport protein A [Clostridiaceae bacterium]
MPLSMAGAGETNYIRKIIGKDQVRRHLENLGFVIGEPVTVISQMNGNMILSIKNSRIALDKSMANRIMI